MIKGAMVQRLEALLERVRGRAAEPRPMRGEAKAPEPEASEVLGARISAAPPMPAGPTDSGWPKPEIDTLVRGTVPVESAAEERPVGDAHDSRERLVAAQSLTTEESAPRAEESVPPIDLAEVEVAEQVAEHEVAEREEPQEDAREEPPASSRRPVAPQPEEQIAQIAFGAEDPGQRPLHTPPPESGRLPSAPAEEFDQDAEFSGVHSPTPLLPRRMAEAVVPRALVPEALRPQLAPSDNVADVIAEAQRFAPSTFVALLDASLGLF